MWRPDGTLEQFESRLERDRLLLLRIDPAVIDWEVQPITLEYQDASGRARRYVPDLLIRQRSIRAGIWREDIVIEEVKYAAVLVERRAEWRDKWRGVRDVCRKRGWWFRIFTDQMLHQDRLYNAQLLRRYAENPGEADIPIAVETILRRFGPMTISHIQHSFSAKGERAAVIGAVILWMVHARRLSCDLNRRLGRNTLVALL